MPHSSIQFLCLWPISCCSVFVNIEKKNDAEKRNNLCNMQIVGKKFTKSKFICRLALETFPSRVVFHLYGINNPCCYQHGCCAFYHITAGCCPFYHITAGCCPFYHITASFDELLCLLTLKGLLQQCVSINKDLVSVFHNDLFLCI